MLQPADAINRLKDSLASVFCCYDKLVVHQFGFTILYLPVYMALDEISQVVNNKRKTKGESWKIEFQSSKKQSDTETVKQLLCDTEAANSFLQGVLHLGLSEVYHHRNDAQHALSTEQVDKLIYEKSGIIDRVPIWGVALANNSAINRIRKERAGKYWPHFESKMSLLKRGDFRTLRVSLYPEGSTVYRLFLNYLKGIGPRSLAPAELETREFDDLFKGVVDVAITVQPWMAIAEAVAKDLDVELVYNHLDPPRPFTHLYGRKLDGGASSPPLGLFFRCLSLYVQSKVEELYRAVNDVKKLAKLARYYCCRSKTTSGLVAIYPSGTCGCNNGSHGKNRRKCEDTMAHQTAIQVLNDSRIYHHPGDLQEGIPEIQSLVREIKAWERGAYFTSMCSGHAGEDGTLKTCEDVYSEMSSTRKNFSELTMAQQKFLMTHFPYEAHNELPEDAVSELDPIYEATLIMNGLPFRRASHPGACPSSFVFPTADTTASWNKNVSRWTEQDERPDLETQAKQLWHIAVFCGVDMQKKNKCRCAGCVKKAWREDWVKHEGQPLSVLAKRMKNSSITYHDNKPLRFYAPHGALEEAFRHFTDQDEIQISAIAAGSINGQNLILTWLIFYYTTKTSDLISDAKFVLKSENPIGHKILNGWHCQDDGEQPQALFSKKGHGVLEAKNGQLFLNNVSIGKRPAKGGRVWVFTFRTVPDIKKSGQKGRKR